MSTAVGDLRLHVRYDEGAGPVIVLLHGINSDASSWRTVIDTIGPGYRVIAPDLLGFGESPKPTDLDYTADEHVAVLAATLDDLGVTERFLLVGYSMGGNVAIRYAATHPERLRRLFLLSAPFYLPPEAYSRASFGWQYSQARLFQWLWRFIGRQQERDTGLYGVLSGPLRRQMSDFMRTDDLDAHWAIMQKNLHHTIMAATFVDDLPRLTMPTVFALGIRDPIVRPDQTMALKRVKPTLEVRRIVGLSADHMLLVKAPARVADEILADEVRALHVRLRRGAGPPTVLLPGLGEDGSAWQPVADRLAGGRDVVVLDPLGAGDSPRPLAGHYTLEDHAAAVHATLTDLFGDEPVTLVGQGFGATVALECAASDPARVRDVVAFSPVLLAPGQAGADQRSEPGVARVLAARDAYTELARDERAQQRAGERLEADVVPLLRSIDAILATDAAALLDRQQRPVRLVLPASDATTPRAWLTEVAAGRSDLEAVEVAGDERYPYGRPAAAASLIGGGPALDDETPVPVLPVRPTDAVARRLLGGANTQLLRHGVLALLGGLALLLVPVAIPPRVVAWAFAGWLLVEAIQTIAGAVGLRRHGNSWLGWLLIGLVSVPFAALLAAGDAFAVGVLVWVVAGCALARAGTALFAAWHAPTLPGRRGGLVVEGLLALAVAVLLLVMPEAAGRLLRWVLGGYLAASGVASLSLAYAAHVGSTRRIREYLARRP